MLKELNASKVIGQAVGEAIEEVIKDEQLKEELNLAIMRKIDFLSGIALREYYMSKEEQNG